MTNRHIGGQPAKNMVWQAYRLWKAKLPITQKKYLHILRQKSWSSTLAAHG